MEKRGSGATYYGALGATGRTTYWASTRMVTGSPTACEMKASWSKSKMSKARLIDQRSFDTKEWLRCLSLYFTNCDSSLQFRMASYRYLNICVPGKSPRKGAKATSDGLKRVHVEPADGLTGAFGVGSQDGWPEKATGS